MNQNIFDQITVGIDWDAFGDDTKNQFKTIYSTKFKQIEAIWKGPGVAYTADTVGDIVKSWNFPAIVIGYIIYVSICFDSVYFSIAMLWFLFFFVCL